MKDNHLQDLKPVYIHEASYLANTEISMVDLAMVLLRRRKIIAGVVAPIIILSVAAALMMPSKYTYSASIAIGHQVIDGIFTSFESPQTLLAKLEHGYIQQTLNEYSQSTNKDMKEYEIKASIPKNSKIIVVELKGTEDQVELISSLLHDLTNKAINDHSKIYEAIKKNLNTQKRQAKLELSSLDNEIVNQTEIIRMLRNSIEIFESQLVNLQNTREIIPPTKSIEPTGLSGKLIVIIAALTGLFLGVFLAFFAEFLDKVKEKIGFGSGQMR